MARYKVIPKRKPGRLKGYSHLKKTKNKISKTETGTKKNSQSYIDNQNARKNSIYDSLKKELNHELKIINIQLKEYELCKKLKRTSTKKSTNHNNNITILGHGVIEKKIPHPTKIYKVTSPSWEGWKTKKEAAVFILKKQKEEKLKQLIWVEKNKKELKSKNKTQIKNHIYELDEDMPCIDIIGINPEKLLLIAENSET